MRTDYASHDHRYRQLRAGGSAGWDGGAEDYAHRFAELATVLDGGSAPRAGRLIELGCGAGNVSLWL